MKTFYYYHQSLNFHYQRLLYSYWSKSIIAIGTTCKHHQIFQRSNIHQNYICRDLGLKTWKLFAYIHFFQYSTRWNSCICWTFMKWKIDNLSTASMFLQYWRRRNYTWFSYNKKTRSGLDSMCNRRCTTKLATFCNDC